MLGYTWDKLYHERWKYVVKKILIYYSGHKRKNAIMVVWQEASKVFPISPLMGEKLDKF